MSVRQQAAGRRRKEKRKRRKRKRKKGEKEKGEKEKGKRKKRRGGAGGIRGDGREPGVASMRSDAHKEGGEQGKFKQ